MNIPSVPKITNPALIDKAIGEMQDVLKAKLPWIDHVFGRAQRLITIKDGDKGYQYPGIHLWDGRYISMFPDAKYGNFAFFFIEDPQIVKALSRGYNSLQVSASVVFWFNLATIFELSRDRYLDNVKKQILTVLNWEMYIKSGRFTPGAIYEKAENIYKGFSIKEIDSQFLMHPYAGLRFEGNLLIPELC